ncbi:hypothetical protein AA103196_0161 [Ameyamaea chiangmaiensis NBRC 103196]|uniref:Uncharacterized protein n=1 Tax=Ameyamaea chiangmaiensis TaxID=442969 RepID=A0A850PGJ7_9PROT|nr:hypothetical protein [Ameyamaea chiangmaiensis]MBS4076435.1 hypothetical protein [Ameyamaea chiangmaiensis]NVN41769.1 hypothetical protein [Ameyamaea chiangmaiensis]GBQ61874.1 hypothetical protein AA103196_0161 [Ameyamaea chiangmaiensis NBRC 103196]
MTGPAEVPARPTATEDTPAAPGWVESRVDALFGSLPQQGPSLRLLRNAYLDCLAAGLGGAGDLDCAHDRCRAALMKQLTAREGLGASAARAFEQKLEALEAEITARI